MARARQGDGRAFDDLVVAHEKRVWSLAVHLCGQRDDAREITQEVFLRVHQHLASYDPSRPFAAWIYRITVNCAYDFIKRRPRATAMGEEMPAPITSPFGASPPPSDPESALQRAEMRRILAGLLQTCLSPRERAVFVLRDVEGLSSREIAYVLRCTTITVRRHSATARLKLREALRSRFPGLLGRG